MIQVTKFGVENQDINFKQKLVLHRLRGFGFPDASKPALQKCIESKIHAIEIDVRFTKDNVAVVNHDATLRKLFQSNEFIARKTILELKNIPHKRFNNSYILSFEEFCQTCASYDSLKILCVDIKESGGEKIILNLLEKNNLLEKTVIISWLPEVLFNVYKIRADIPLCFSHFPSTKLTGYFFKKYFANPLKYASILVKRDAGRHRFHFNKYNEAQNNQPKIGFDYEHFVFPFLSGKLLEILIASHGWVCIPFQTATIKLIERYKNSGIKVCLFTINRIEQIKKLEMARKSDFILTDEAKLFFTES